MLPAVMCFTSACLASQDATKALEAVRSLGVGLDLDTVHARLEQAGVEHSVSAERPRVIRAIVRGVKRTVTTETSLQFKLYFNDENRLERIEETEVFTGP